MGGDQVASRVQDILKSIQKEKNDSPKVNAPAKKSKKAIAETPRGKPKSGRIWKDKKQKFSTIRKTKGQHMTFAEKEQLRIKLKQTKETSREIREQNKVQVETRKQRRRDNIKKAEERRLKSEIVQVISNSAKIKRMKKKQLRFIEKRDTAQISK